MFLFVCMPSSQKRSLFGRVFPPSLSSLLVLRKIEHRKGVKKDPYFHQKVILRLTYSIVALNAQLNFFALKNLERIFCELTYGKSFIMIHVQTDCGNCSEMHIIVCIPREKGSFEYLTTSFSPFLMVQLLSKAFALLYNHRFGPGPMENIEAKQGVSLYWKIEGETSGYSLLNLIPTAVIVKSDYVEPKHVILYSGTCSSCNNIYMSRPDQADLHAFISCTYAQQCGPNPVLSCCQFRKVVKHSKVVITFRSRVCFRSLP